MRDLLESAIDHGDRGYEEADILAQVLLGRWQCWAGSADGHIEAVLITDVLDFPRLRKCLIRYAAGDGRMFEGTIGQLEDWARDIGCTVLEVPAGRDGWVRRLPIWDDHYMVMQRNL